MKNKLLLLLLLATSSISFAQTTLANKLKITANITSTTATKVNVQEADGTVNTMPLVGFENVIEVDNYAALPGAGLSLKLYVTRDTNKLYRWNGNTYVDVAYLDISEKENLYNKVTNMTYSDTDYPSSRAVKIALDNKVDKVDGKSLVLDSEIEKLSTLEYQDISGKQDISKRTDSPFEYNQGYYPSSIALREGLSYKQDIIVPLKQNKNESTVFARGSLDISTNTAFGDGALISLTSNNSKNTTAIGYGALRNTTTGYDLTALGFYSSFYATTASRNTSIGAYSLQHNSAGDSNATLGYFSGTYSLAPDNFSEEFLTDVSNSVFLGAKTKARSNNDTNEIVIGYMAYGAGSNTATLGNEDITKTVLRGEVSGGSFVKNGAPATNLLLAGGGDMPLSTLSPAEGILEYTLADRTIWSNGKSNIDTNTGFGEGTLTAITSGGFNTAVGKNSLTSSTTGALNVSVGMGSMEDNINGSFNASMGYNALSASIAGNYNVAIGTSAGSTFGSGGTSQLLTVSEGIFLGYQSRALLDSSKNEIAIGNKAVGAGSNTATLGNTSITKTVLRGVIQQTTYTVATLPSGTLGMFAVVTDATSPTYLGALTGGGTIKCPVFFNGTIWVSH